MISKELFIQELEKLFEPEIYARGIEYFQSGLAINCDIDFLENGLLEIYGTISGSEEYLASIALDCQNKKIVDYSCDCPCTYPCKHAVALGFKYAEVLAT